MERMETRVNQPDTDATPVMSTRQWAISIFITCIPVVGLVMLFLWSFKTGGVNGNKRNWARGMLIIIALGSVATILYYAVLALGGFGVQQF